MTAAELVDPGSVGLQLSVKKGTDHRKMEINVFVWTPAKKVSPVSTGASKPDHLRAENTEVSFVSC